MEDKKIKNIYGCSNIEAEGELYPLQKWYNQVIEKTISEITIADVLRMMRQNEFVELAISRAIDYLKDNPFAGELYEGELLEKVSMFDINQIRDYSDEIRNILEIALKENEVYEWLNEDERMAFKKIVNSFSEKIG